jgi:hypothetical protein
MIKTKFGLSSIFALSSPQETRIISSRTIIPRFKVRRLLIIVDLYVERTCNFFIFFKAIKAEKAESDIKKRHILEFLKHS